MSEARPNSDRDVSITLRRPRQGHAGYLQDDCTDDGLEEILEVTESPSFWVPVGTIATYVSLAASGVLEPSTFLRDMKLGRAIWAHAGVVTGGAVLVRLLYAPQGSRASSSGSRRGTAGAWDTPRLLTGRRQAPEHEVLTEDRTVGSELNEAQH